MPNGQVWCGNCVQWVSSRCETEREVEACQGMLDTPSTPLNKRFHSDLPGEPLPYSPVREPDPYED